MSRQIKRRAFVKKVGALALGSAGLSACGRPGSEGPAVHTRKRLRWRLASSFPRSLDTIYGAAELFSRRVGELTGGNFEIRVYPGGELAPALQVLDSVQSGSAEIGHTAGYYYIGKSEALAFDTTVPFGLSARQQCAWLGQGGGRVLMEEVYGSFGVLPLPGGNTGAQMGGWFRREFDGLAGLKGLKMRIPGLGGKVMSALGVTVQNISGGEIYSALERGALDATEWVGPHDDLKLKFYEVARTYYYPGWWEPGANLSFLVNRKAWEELPVDYQAALRAAASESAAAMLEQYDARNPLAFAALPGLGVQLHAFPADVMDAAAEVMRSMARDAASRDPVYATVLAHWEAFRATSSRWFANAELAMLHDQSRRV